MDSDMNRTESKMSDSSGRQNYTDAENSKWLAENLNEMERSIQRMLKLIEANMEASTNKADLVAGVEESHCVYQSLAKRYSRLTQELLNNHLPPEFQHQESNGYDSGRDQNGSLLTPNQKLDLSELGKKSVTSSSGSGISNISPDANNEYSSSFDSESESFYSSLNHYLVSPAKTDSQGLKEKESALKVGEQMSYGVLKEQIIKYEEELKVTVLKFRVAEQEIEKLKNELERSESAVVIAENLRAKLEEAQSKIEIRAVDVEMEKRRVFELQSQVLHLETKLSDSNSENKRLMNEVEGSRYSLKASNDQILKLREALYDCQQNFSTQKAKMQSDINRLLEKQTLRETQVEELKFMYEAKEVQWQDEISRLKDDIAARSDQWETLNKDFDKHKLKHDMLVAEKDGAAAKMDSLTAEVRSRNLQISQMEENLKQMLRNYNELVSVSDNAKKSVDDLRSRVQELEKQVEQQIIVISEGEEEKREAIRQLCFSLDHYRSGYRQLVRSLSANRRQTVMAS